MADASADGIENIKARLKGVLAAKKDALKAAGVAVLTNAQQTITNGGDGWQPWSKNYKPKRAHQMLWDTGTLLRSLTVGDANNIFDQENDNTIIVGSNVKYAAAQNFGYSPRNLPARPFLLVNAKTQDVAQRAFVAKLQKALNP